MRVALTPAAISGGGGGHVVRCLALAEALQNEGGLCTFILEAWGAALLRRLSWTGSIVEANTVAARIDAICDYAPDATVVDDYHLGEGFERRLPGLVMAIDDFTDRAHACAVLLDSAYGRAERDYTWPTQGIRALLGPRYVLMRKGFALSREPRLEIERVFVCFGLSDVGGIAARATRLLRPLAPLSAFDVALGADAQSVGALRTMSEADPGLTLHIDADVAPLMHAADLGVGAGGGMVWERRAANLAQLVVTVAENQRPMAARLAHDGVISTVDLADPDFDARLQRAFVALGNVAVRRAQAERQGAECDGLGAERAARALIAAVG